MTANNPPHLREAPMSAEPIGYVVLSRRPSQSGGYNYNPAGAIWPDIEPCTNGTRRTP